MPPPPRGTVRTAEGGVRRGKPPAAPAALLRAALPALLAAAFWLFAAAGPAAPAAAQSIAASDIGQNSVKITLTRAGYTGTWHYSVSGGTIIACTGNISEDSVTITGLTQGTRHTVTVYASCAGGTSERLINGKILEATFTTLSGPTLTLGDADDDGATSTTIDLTLANHTGAWWYKHDNNGACTPVASGQNTATATGLAPNTQYTFTAYSDNVCGTEIASAASGTTLRAPVRNMQVFPLDRGFYVTWSAPAGGAENYDVEWKSGDQKRLKTTGKTFYKIADDPVNFNNGTTYTISVRPTYNYPAEYGERTEMEVTPAEETLTASRVTHNGAVLTLANYTGQGDWYYKYTAPVDGGAACTQAAAGPAATGPPVDTDYTVAVTGLRGGTDYTFKAYTDDICTTEVTNDGTDAEFRTLETGPAARKRLAEVNRAIAPEVARAAVSGIAEAVKRRVRGAFSGRAPDTAEGAAGLAGALKSYGEALNRGGGSRLPGGRLPGGAGQPDSAAALREALAGRTVALDLAAAPGSAADRAGLRGVGVWAAADYRRLSGGGRDRVDWKGGVTGLHAGADVRFGGGILAGLAASWNEAAFDYSGPSGSITVAGEHKTRLAGATLYGAKGSAADRAALWGLLGYRTGEVRTADDEAGRQKADAGMMLAAMGGRFALLRDREALPGADTTLDLEAEAMAARLRIADNGGAIAGLSARTFRLRLALAGAAAFRLGGGTVLTPSLALGARVDGGGGETGAGAEFGGGVAWTARRVRLDAQGRIVLVKGGRIKEWGAGGGVQVSPRPGGAGASFGLTLSAGPSGGARGLHAQGAGSLDRLADGTAGDWRDGADSAASGAPLRLDAEAGYGLAAPGVPGAVLTPFAGFGVDLAGAGAGAGSGAARARLGLRLDRGPALRLTAEAARARTAGQPADNRLTVRLDTRW